MWTTTIIIIAIIITLLLLKYGPKLGRYFKTNADKGLVNGTFVDPSVLPEGKHVFGSEGPLAHIFATFLGDFKHGKHVTETQIHLGKFLSELKKNFHEVILLYREVNENHGKVVYKVVNVKEGIRYTGLIQCSARDLMTNYTSDPEAGWQGVGWKLGGPFVFFRESSEMFTLVEDVVLYYPHPAEFPKSDLKVKYVLAAVENSRVHWVSPKETNDEVPSRSFDLLKSRHGSFYLKEYELPSDWNINEELLKLSYPHIDFLYQRKFERLVNPIEGVLSLCTSLNISASFGFTGITGTGKSRLMWHIIHKLSTNPNVFVVRITKNLLMEMLQSSFDWRGIFQEQIDRENPEIVLYCDEIDDLLTKEPSLFKELTDGVLTNQLNIRMAFTFNKAIEAYEEHKALFRECRSLIFQVNPLPKEAAKPLADYIASTPTNELKAFSWKSFERLMAQEDPEQLVISAVWNCLQPKNLTLDFESQLEALWETKVKPSLPFVTLEGDVIPASGGEFALDEGSSSEDKKKSNRRVEK